MGSTPIRKRAVTNRHPPSLALASYGRAGENGGRVLAAWRLPPASASSAQAAFQPPRLVGRSLGEG